jgi:CHAD domain-containing protein
MRVAIRRARAALRLFGGHFRRRVLLAFQRQLKELARALGPVRDADVALENLRVFRRRLDKADRPAVKPLRQALKAQRTEAFHHLRAHLDSPEYAKFIVAFDAFCTTPGRAIAKSKAAPQERPPRQIRHTVSSIILTGFEHVRAYEVAFTGPTLPELELFHALRIQTKYFRYSLEFLQPLLGVPGKSIIAQLKELQEHLGLLNDAHVEQIRLEAWAEVMVDNPALALRAEQVAATIDRLTVELPPRLAQFISPNNRRLLGEALARI